MSVLVLLAIFEAVLLSLVRKRNWSLYICLLSRCVLEISFLIQNFVSLLSLSGSFLFLCRFIVVGVCNFSSCELCLSIIFSCFRGAIFIRKKVISCNCVSWTWVMSVTSLLEKKIRHVFLFHEELQKKLCDSWWSFIVEEERFNL